MPARAPLHPSHDERANLARDFASHGYALVPGILSAADCATVADHLLLDAPTRGTRCLLDHAWCAGLAKDLRGHDVLSTLIPPTHVAVQCTSFEKSADHNWLGPFHQDLSVPVAERIESSSLRGWSEKEGIWFVQPPAILLEALICVRIHLDDCLLDDGPLRVSPGSHQAGRLDEHGASLTRARAGELAVPAQRGSALLLRPLLLHASSKSTGTSRRRVLHFVFGPPSTGLGLNWRHAI